MKFTNSQIEIIIGSKAYEEVMANSKMPIRVKFELKKLDSKIREVAKIYLELKQKVIEKYCDKDSEGNPIVKNQQYTFSNPSKEFVDEINQLLNLESEIEFEKIKIKIDDLSELNINARDLFVLEYIFDFVE